MIAIIGGSGFIGTYLMDELIAQGREVFVTGRTHLDEDYYASRGIPCARVDITNKQDFEKLPKENLEAVVLLAGLMPANVVNYDPQQYVDVNVTGTLNVLEYCRTYKAKKMIFTGSHSDAAMLWDSGEPIREDDPLIGKIVYTGDHAIYIITKITAQEMLEHYHQDYGIQGITMRLPAVYGCGPHLEIYVDGKRHVTGLKVFMDKAMAGEPIEIWGDPTKGRDIVYVKDVAAAYIGAINSDTAHGSYNVATGIRTTLEQEVRGVIEVFGPPDKKSEIIYRPDKPNNLHIYLYDISKAQRDLGYEVKYPYMKMLQDYKIEIAKQRFPHLMRRESKA